MRKFTGKTFSKRDKEHSAITVIHKNGSEAV
jgi:hypothetical protein